MSARIPWPIRVLDVVGAFVGLAITWPLWLACAVAIKVESRGPVFHRGKRVGQSERIFEMLKFRSMRPSDGLAITVAGDPRITGVGRFLRATKLDELPQLLNVLRGEMSLVGPRPEDPRYLDRMPADFREVFSFRPGMTGPASIRYRHEEKALAKGANADPETYYIERLLPEKAMIDLAYLKNHRTVRSDVSVLWATARSVIGSSPSA